jgi:putative nucleotidyltransferase with HDIG domain
MDVFMRMKGHGMKNDYFIENANVTFSAAALKAFYAAQNKYSILEKLNTGEYQQELSDLFSNVHFTENYKKRLLGMLIYAIDFRSYQTVVHSLATTTFATSIARLMRLPSEQLQIVYYGALLHDIGKIAIPLEILEAPRRLNDEEMRIMKAHVMITEKILRGIINDEVLEVSIRHHEKLDGTGYHRGLKGDEINTAQRIVAVADILSALYGKRSYKEAMSIDQITSILEGDAQSGKICPEITGMVVRNLPNILKDFEKSKEVTIGLYESILKGYDETYAKFKHFDKHIH